MGRRSLIGTRKRLEPQNQWERLHVAEVLTARLLQPQNPKMWPFDVAVVSYHQVTRLLFSTQPTQKWKHQSSDQCRHRTRVLLCYIRLIVSNNFILETNIYVIYKFYIYLSFVLYTGGVDTGTQVQGNDIKGLINSPKKWLHYKLKHRVAIFVYWTM